MLCRPSHALHCTALQLWEERHSHRGADLPPDITQLAAGAASKKRKLASDADEAVLAREVVDLTGDDGVDLVDAETWVLECLMVREVKAEHGLEELLQPAGELTIKQEQADEAG
jgi:hypothetical protein